MLAGRVVFVVAATAGLYLLLRSAKRRCTVPRRVDDRAVAGCAVAVERQANSELVLLDNRTSG
jgi:hypothetical protein